MNSPDFEGYGIAGARLLGHDMARQTGPEALAVIRDVLGHDLRDSALAAAATGER